MKLFNQNRKLPAWLGGIQVQFSNSLIYVTPYNTFMLAMTFWYTTGSVLANKYASWVTIEYFLGASVLVFATFVLIDYKFMLPARLSFINKQTCDAQNPAMDELKELRKENKEIKETLGIILEAIKAGV